MSDMKPSNEFLRHHAKRLEKAAGDKGPLSDPQFCADMHSALTELLQRRKDGQSPEEFVLNAAQRLGDVPQPMRGLLLASLSEIERHVLRARQVLAGKEP